MKRTILLLIMALLSTAAMAQRNEFRVGYGIASTNRLLNTEHGIFGINWKQEYKDLKAVNTSAGTITFGYRYQVSRIRIGLAGSYEKMNGIYKFSDDYGMETETKGQHKYWTVAADLQFSYLKMPKGIVELYWGASAGLAFVSQDIKTLVDDVKRNRFAYQVVPIGLSVGIPWIGAYAELGFGYRGVLNVGAYIRF